MTHVRYASKRGLAAAMLAIVTLVPHVAFADDAEALQQRVRELEQRLERLEGHPASSVGSGSAVVPAGAVTLDDPFDDDPDAVQDERLGVLEEALEEFRDEVADELDPGPVTFDPGGRIHADYWSFPITTDGIGFFENPDPASPLFGNDPSERFLFRRVRLELKGDVYETMLWRIQIDFNNPSSAEAKDIFIGFDELPNNQTFLVGIQKRPLGMDHLNSSRFNVFAERPLVVEAFNEDARRPGMAMYGYTDDESMGWAYGVYLLQNVTRTGRYFGDSAQASGNARIFGSPWYDESSNGRGFFHCAIAGMFANPDGDADGRVVNTNEARFRTRVDRSTSRWLNTERIPGAKWYEIVGLEAMLNVGSFHIVSEYMAAGVQRDNTTPGTGPDLFFHGFYVHAGYFLTGESMAYNRQRGTIARVKPFENFFVVDRCCGGRGRGWGAWQVAFRYDWLSLSDEDILGGKQNTYTVGLNWYWTPNSKLQFNLIWGDIYDHRPVGGFTDGDFLIAGTRFQIDF